MGLQRLCQSQNLGELLFKQNRFNDAIICFNKSISIGLKCEQIQQKINQSLKKLNQCESTLKRIIDKEIGEKPVPFFFKGMALLNLNRYEEAIECFDKIISLNPQNAEAFSSKGKCLQFLRRLPQAIKAFETAISLNPKNSEYAELKEQVSQKLSFKQGKDHYID